MASSSQNQGETIDSSRRPPSLKEQRAAAKRQQDEESIKGNLVNGSSSSAALNIPTRPAMGAGTIIPSTTFEAGVDFIPFELSDASDEEGVEVKSHTDVKGKGKGKAAEDEDTQFDRQKSAAGQRERERDRKDDRRATEPSRSKEQPTREWDRGKRDRDWDDDRRRHGGRDHDRDRDRDRSYKRKYDEYQGDDRERSRRRESDSSRKCPWMSGLDLEKCQSVAEMLQCEVESFIEWISPTPIEDELRGLVVDHIAKAIRNPFPDSQVHPFGSYQTKLYLPSGDIDLVVLSDAMTHIDKTTVLHMMATALKRSGVASNVTIIAHARVPIVKFVSSYGRFKVDISINQTNGLISGGIITGFLKQLVPCAEGKESKALKGLVMIVKAFLVQRRLNEVYKGGLGSYSVVCLVVSFLQMHPKNRHGEIDPEKNLGVLVMEFFELYGNRFNYDEVGISLRDGGTYFSKRQRGWHADYKKNMLTIEDPADPSNDISSGSYFFYKVKAAFAGAYGLLASTVYLRAGMLTSRHQGRSVQFRWRYEPEDLSILSALMDVAQETINHRRLVQELYDKRVLHKILGVEPAIHKGELGQKSCHLEQGPSSTSNNARVVESSWRSKVKDDSDDDDGSQYERRRPTVYDDEGGRYDIGRPSPSSKRRRKTGPSEDVYFVPDRDEDSRDGRSEGEVIESGANEDDYRRPMNKTTRKRRAYWLAKSPGMMHGDMEES